MSPSAPKTRLAAGMDGQRAVDACGPGGAQVVFARKNRLSKL
ncbi:MAG: hypothetical protein ACYDDT_08920 [Sulfuricella sp.]